MGKIWLGQLINYLQIGIRDVFESLMVQKWHLILQWQK